MVHSKYFPLYFQHKIERFFYSLMLIFSSKQKKHFSMGFFSQGYGLFHQAVPMQDSTHKGTKGRNRFLRTWKPLIIGKYIATPDHLQELIEKLPVTVHALNINDLNSNDKMKFSSVKKICSSRVLECLRSNILNQSNKGTIAYLELLKDITEAFLDKTIDVLERIRMVWRSVFFCRVWRKNIENSKDLKLSINFITPNLYACIELNAHGLLNILKILRERSLPRCFLSWLFGSQPCEELFRAARSMTPTESTIINFSAFDFVHKLKRIEIVNEMPNKLKTVSFPNRTIKLDYQVCTSLPNDLDINETIKKAASDAREKCLELGLIFDEKFIYDPDLNFLIPDEDINKYDSEDDSEDEITTETEEDIANDEEAMFDLKEINKMYPAFSSHQIALTDSLSENSAVKVRNSETNEIQVIKISTLCWIFDKNSNREAAPSTDRTRRFIENSSEKKKQ